MSNFIHITKNFYDKKIYRVIVRYPKFLNASIGRLTTFSPYLVGAIWKQIIFFVNYIIHKSQKDKESRKLHKEAIRKMEEYNANHST